MSAVELNWVKELLRENDPWVLHSNTEDHYEHRDAFIGNGYIGQRIGSSGDGSDYHTGSASFMHGFWNDRNLMALPRWAILRLHECDYGQSIMWRSAMGSRKNYQQKLFLKEGRVETSYHYQTNKIDCQVRTTALMPRHEKNLGVIQLEIESLKNNTIYAIESTLDGFYCEQANDFVTEDIDGIQYLFGKMGNSQYPIQIVSGLECSIPEADKVEVFSDGRKTTRVLYYKLNKGHKLTITKWVSIKSREGGTLSKEAEIQQVKSYFGTYDEVLRKHQQNWMEFWKHHIEVPEVSVQAIVNAALYYFGSNLRKGVNWSLGPCGIAGRHWGSRVFWDADLWMHPVVALLYPELGDCFVEYRLRTHEGARKNAQAEGRLGVCIAWESAETGEEKVNSSQIHEQRHVNTDVAFMLYKHALIRGDQKWLQETALPLIRDIADFWVDRCEWDEQKKKYVLKGIYCPDEFAGIRDNNAHTNFCATWALQLAYDLSQKAGMPIREEWLKIASEMHMPWNEQRKIWDEYEGWTGEEKIKQADTTLMIYPYEKSMENDLKQRLNDYYASCYESNKIMMGSAIDGIIDCELGRSDKAWEALRDMLPHFRTPYLCVSERPTNETINFLTGLGGFLQLLVMGFAGVRIHEKELIVQPSLPKYWDRIRIKGLQYQGSLFDVMIERDHASVQLLQKGETPCQIQTRGGDILYQS